jgi:hypothetical protein
MSALTRLFGVPLCLAALSAITPAQAQETVGRYQMVPLAAKPGSFDTRVMILDTSEGHLWQWWEAPSIGGGTPGSGITYLGKVGPGASVTGSAQSNHPVPPMPIIPHH